MRRLVCLNFMANWAGRRFSQEFYTDIPSIGGLRS